MKDIALFQRQNNTFPFGKACSNTIYRKKIHDVSKFQGCNSYSNCKEQSISVPF